VDVNCEKTNFFPERKESTTNISKIIYYLTLYNIVYNNYVHCKTFFTYKNSGANRIPVQLLHYNYFFLRLWKKKKRVLSFLDIEVSS